MPGGADGRHHGKRGGLGYVAQYVRRAVAGAVVAQRMMIDDGARAPMDMGDSHARRTAVVVPIHHMLRDAEDHRQDGEKSRDEGEATADRR